MNYPISDFSDVVRFRSTVNIAALINMRHTITLYGGIGHYDEINASSVAAQLRGKTLKELEVRVHSGGGDVFEGFALYNYFQSLKAAGTRITFYVDGLAASMMSFVILAGDEIRMAGNSMIMVHAPSVMARGNAAKLREAALLVEKIQEMMQAGYQQLTGKPAAEVAEWLKKDTFFTPAEAKQAGIATQITAAVMTATLPELSAATLESVYASFTPISNPNPISMKAIATLLDLSAEASEETIMAKVRELRSQLVTATANAATLETRATTAEATLLEMQAAGKKQAAGLLVQSALEAGKITAAQKDQFQKLAEMDYDSTAFVMDSMSGFKSITAQITASAAEDPNKALVDEYVKRHKEGTLAKLKASNEAHFKAIQAAYLENLKANA